MTTLQDEFDKLIVEQLEVKRKFQERARELFKGVTKEFFAKNPGITAVKWAQYTPYFNDGEECVFRVNTPSVTNCPVDELQDVSKWGEYEGEREDVFCTDNVSWVISDRCSKEYYNKERAILTKMIDNNQIDVKSIEKFIEMIEHPEMEDIMLAMFGDHVTVTATRAGFDVEDLEHD